MRDAVAEFTARLPSYEARAHTPEVRGSLWLVKDDLATSLTKQRNYLLAVAESRDAAWVFGQVKWRTFNESAPKESPVEDVWAVAELEPQDPYLLAAEAVAYELAKLRPEISSAQASEVIALFPDIVNVPPERAAVAIDAALDRVELLHGASFPAGKREPVTAVMMLLERLDAHFDDSREAEAAKRWVVSVVEDQGAFPTCNFPNCADLVWPISERTGRLHRGRRYCRSHDRQRAAHARAAS